MKIQSHRQVLLWCLLLFAIAACAQSDNDHSLKPITMTSPSVQEKNKRIVRSFYEDALNKRNDALLSEMVSADYTGIRGLKGAEAIKASVRPLIVAFPDIHYEIEELLGEEDKVTVRWKWQGTHQYMYQQFAATGKRMMNEGMAIYELKDGKITGSHMQVDRLGFLQELGAVPLDLRLQITNQVDKDQVQFIDKFVVPAAAKEEFMNRVKINRAFIKTVNGFVEDAVYESKDEKGNFLLITVATWQNEEALKKAKAAVQAEYKQEGFDPAALMERLHITMERGLYKRIEDRP